MHITITAYVYPGLSTPKQSCSFRECKINELKAEQRKIFLPIASCTRC